MRFIIVGLDGLRPDAVTAVRMPRLAQLREEATRFANARSVFPSETRVATPSLLTGCRPGAHGLIANQLYDAILAPDRVLNTKDYADISVLAGAGGSPLLRPSLGERLHAAGKRLDLVSAGTPGATIAMHPLAERLGTFRWNAADTEGAAAALVRERFGPTPAAAKPNIARAHFAARVFTEMVLAEMRPDVGVLWCPEPDVAWHYFGLGGPEADAALACADAVLGRVLDWRAAQPDRDDIGLIVLSDHGHVTGPWRVDVAAELARAGFAVGSGLDPDVDVVVAPGAAPGFWLRHPALAPRLAGFLAEQAWAGPLFARDPAILEGAAPLALLGSAHPRSPDLTLCFAGSEAADAHGFPGMAPFDAADVPAGGGMHGGLHRGELATVLVMDGPMFRRAAEVRAMADLTDVVPTLLHLLDLPRDGTEGRVLTQAWDAGSDAEPEPSLTQLMRGFVLEGATQFGRYYPTGLRRH